MNGNHPTEQTMDMDFDISLYTEAELVNRLLASGVRTSSERQIQYIRKALRHRGYRVTATWQIHDYLVRATRTSA